MKKPTRPLRLALSMAVASTLAACGSGGGDDQPEPPATGVITLTGVVARGAALANASLAVTCSTGSGNTTTNANGAYSLSITSGALPCVLQATSSDSSTRLHSVAPAGSSRSLTVNVTPLTELVVARLTGAVPATYLAGLGPSTLAGTASASNVAAAQASVVGTLAAGGVNTSSAGDFISGTLVAAVPGTPGNAYDQVLDTLNDTLTSAGTTLAALTSTIAAGNTAPPVGGGGASSAEATLPADLLLRPKAANCASLASGRYRLVKQAASPGDTVTALELMDFDAATLSFTSVANPADGFSLVANGNCRYTLQNGPQDQVLVSPAGVLVARVGIGADDDTVALSVRGTTRLIVGLPVQTVAVADLAGNWNTALWSPGADGFEPAALTATIASSGAITQLKCADNSLETPESACSTVSSLLPAFSNNTAGGFNLTSTDPSDPFTDRAFAYRAGNGDLTVVLLGGTGDFGFLTQARTLSLPAVGSTTTGWNVDVRVSGQAIDPVYGRTQTVTLADASTGRVERRVTRDGNPVTSPETLFFNQSRNGYLHRPAASVVASDGSAANVRELRSLPLRGLGMNAYFLGATTGSGATSNALFGISVARQP